MKRFLPSVALLLSTTAHGWAIEWTVRTAFLACRSETLFEQANALRRTSDNAALQRFLEGVLLSGDCLWLPVGKKVHFDGDKASSIYNTLVRPEGQLAKYFTYRRIFD